MVIVKNPLKSEERDVRISESLETIFLLFSKRLINPKKGAKKVVEVNFLYFTQISLLNSFENVIWDKCVMELHIPVPFPRI